jgi:hypothetical protein
MKPVAEVTNAAKAAEDTGASRTLGLETLPWIGGLEVRVLSAMSGQVLAAAGGWALAMIEEFTRRFPTDLFTVLLFTDVDGFSSAVRQLGEPHFFGRERQPAVIRIGDFKDGHGRVHSTFLERGNVAVWLNARLRFRSNQGSEVIIPHVALTLIGAGS